VIHRARWVLPIDRPPLSGGWVASENGRITGVGQGPAPGPVEDLGDVALLPGLVNAHTHLELAWMEGRVPPAGSMDEWIRAIVELRRAGPSGGETEILDAMARAAGVMRATGTVLVGDISNTLTSPAVLAHAGLGGVVFHELLGFNAPDPPGAVREAWRRVTELAIADWSKPDSGGAGATYSPGLTYSVVAHAPYSVSPQLMSEIARRAGPPPLTIHLGESREEIEFLRTGGGPIRQALEELGVWTDAWRAPASDPVTYVSKLGYVREGTLVVHGVHLRDDSLERLGREGAVLVTCPRSNHWVGAGSPRLPHFYAAGLRVAIGTDSLASTPTLNMFDELAEMRRLAPELSAAKLLESATRRGAEALGYGRDYGTLKAGKRAAYIAVGVPPAVAAGEDVEEYLVSSVPADTIRRVA
jgi:cytosine/adenosine deaminase-related metal-dependent hydrolase